MMDISVIIPAGNEEEGIEATLRSAGDHEIIVATTATDSTPNIASTYGRVIRAQTGYRSHLLNIGAAEATGDTFLFLHADTLLPNDWESTVTKTPGAFQITFDDTHPLMQLTAWYANNVRLRRGIAYGDHGLCISREQFFEIGGYPEVALMEDTILSRKLDHIHTYPATVRTSARRYRAKGYLTQWMTNQKIKTLFHLGVSPESLRASYK